MPAPATALPIPTMSADTPDLSIVIPIYNEVDNLAELVDRVAAAMDPTIWRYELIAIDDGSSDGSAGVLRELAASRDWLIPLELSRNYGQSSALQAGFDRVRGRYVVTLDADLQNDPLDIPALLDRLQTDPSIDMISGWRRDRQDAAVSRRLPSMLANRLISWATGVHLHDYGCGLKAYRRAIIDRIRLYGELHRFMPSLAKDAGARIAEMPVRHHARQRGVSKYGIGRTFRVILDLVLVVFFMRYRQRPLHAFGGLGLALLGSGLAVSVYLVVAKYAGEAVAGRPLLLVGMMLVLMGLQLIVAGLVGEMLTRIYHEGSGRPQVYLREAPTPGATDDSAAAGALRSV